MIKKLLPIILLIFGAGAGIGAGMFLRPPPEAAVPAEGEEVAEKAEEEEAEETVPEFEYLKMSNQFVVPIVDGGRVAAMVVMSLSVEVPVGQTSTVFEHEPKLRDGFLQELFNHANRGGFDGEFTSAKNMDAIRQALREVAVRDMGDLVTDVLILEIARQDM